MGGVEGHLPHHPLPSVLNIVAEPRTEPGPLPQSTDPGDLVCRLWRSRLARRVRTADLNGGGNHRQVLCHWSGGGRGCA